MTRVREMPFRLSDTLAEMLLHKKLSVIGRRFPTTNRLKIKMFEYSIPVGRLSHWPMMNAQKCKNISAFVPIVYSHFRAFYTVKKPQRIGGLQSHQILNDISPSLTMIAV